MNYLKRYFTILLVLVGTNLWSCSEEETPPEEPEEPEVPVDNEPEETPTATQVYADFETVAQSFYTNKSGMAYEIVDNPAPDETNLSDHCGKIVSTADQWELVYSERLEGTFNFDDTTAFTLKVRSTQTGKVFLKIEHPTDWNQGQLEVQQELTVAGEWTTLTFDFAEMDISNDTFGKFVLLFDAGETNAGISWHFDDLTGPPLDKQPALMTRYDQNPVLRASGSGWDGIHIANAAILTPEESPDGKWRLYARGSGHVPELHSQVGLFTQETGSFSPYGPWQEHDQNPVIPYGPAGSYTDKGLLDCAPMVGPDDTFYFYFNAKSYDSPTGALGGASSADGGLTFDKFDEVLKEAVGASDAIYHEGTYYIYSGDGNWNGSSFDGPLQVYLMQTDDPTEWQQENVSLALPVGDQGDFDSNAVNGSRIFRLEDKWFMVYQGSKRHFDFPERFHVAYSDDLVNWTKVNNDQPFFTRGEPGQWDQGAIWFGECFVHDDTLYMYYEGWGCECVIPDRNTPYFAWGISQTGVAEVSVDDFLDWCGL